LERLLRKYGFEAISVIHACLIRAMIGRTDVSKVNRWSYFDGPIEDVPPSSPLPAGDCLGLHRAARQNSNRRRNVFNADRR
jgi:hypothetical protein